MDLIAGTTDVKDVFIINAAGFGRNMAHVARSDPAHGKEWQVVGYLDSRTELAKHTDLPIVGDPLSYRYQPRSFILCAVGDPSFRRKYVAPLLAQDAIFINMQPDLTLDPGSTIGMGCLFERGVKVGVDCQFGSFIILLANTIIGYEVTIGSYTTIGSFVFIGGQAQIGNDVMIHPHATILPGVKIGDGAIIGAGSVVIGNVPPGVTVFGNPAKRFEFK